MKMQNEQLCWFESRNGHKVPTVSLFHNFNVFVVFSYHTLLSLFLGRLQRENEKLL